MDRFQGHLQSLLISGISVYLVQERSKTVVLFGIANLDCSSILPSSILSGKSVIRMAGIRLADNRFCDLLTGFPDC